MGYLPGTIWIIIGAVFAGCVQDYLVLWISTRRRGRSLGQMARDELGAVGGAAAIIGIFVIMMILLAVLALVVVQALAESPWGVFSIAMTIPIAIFMGVYLRFLRPGRVSEVSVIGVALLLLAVVARRLGRRNILGRILVQSVRGHAGMVPDHLRLRRVGAAGVVAARAARLPVDVHEGRHHRAAGDRHLIARPVMQAPAVSEFASSGEGPVFAGSLFPFLFITIACGALSGFHSLISSGTTPKLLEKESQMRLIGYGGMLTESFVGIMALITAAILNQHLYFALNAPAAQTGSTAATAAEYVNDLPLHRRPDHRRADHPSRRGRRREIHRLAHRRRTDAGDRHVGSAAPRVRRHGPQGVLVSLRDHVRGPVHPDHGRRRHPGGPVHAVRRPEQPRRAAAQAARSRAGGSAYGCAAWPSSRRGAASC